MTWRRFELDNRVKETTSDIKLWQSDKGRIEVSKGTLAISLKMGEKRSGYVFHGHGELMLDTIVETKEGAVGQSVEKELSKPFLMIGKVDEAEECFVEVSGEGISGLGYGSQEKFIERAEALCHLFFEGRIHNCQDFNKSGGTVFAFLREACKLDILISDGTELIYTSPDVVFVSDDHEVVLKNPDATVCSSDGESVIIRNGKSLIVEE